MRHSATQALSYVVPYMCSMSTFSCTCTSLSPTRAPYLTVQSAVGWEYQADLSKHESQTDAAKGFGGRYGVQTENVDKVLIFDFLFHLLFLFLP